jgi:tripartite-type tricarboxylate transporter receptor subunit TctC
MYSNLSRAILGVAALALVTGTSATASADAVADFYKGKQVTLLVGFGVGGTYTHYARLMERYMPSFIPGRPTIVVQNMPGAGGIKMTNYAYNVAPKDGSVLMVPSDSIIISQLLTPKSAKYKTNDFTWIGNLIESNSIVVVRSDAGVRTLDDIRNKEIIISSTGKGSQTFLVPSMLKGVFGAKFRIVMGYKGAKGSMHAIEQNEAHGTSLTWLAYITGKPEWFKGPRDQWKGIPIVQVGFTKEKDLPWVPLARDLAKSKEDRQIVDFIASLGPIGRGMAALPGTSQDKIAALRKAFDQMASDPKVIADTKKRKLRLNPKSGKEVQKIVEDILTMPPSVVKRAQMLILGKSSS